MSTHTRRLVLASATAGLMPPTAVSATAFGHEVTVRAKYSGRDVAWEITLTDKYAAKFSAEINRSPIGTITGDFRFYDTEIMEKDQLPKFLALSKTFHAREKPIHPWGYAIAVRNPATGAFHEVSVWFGDDMPRSEELRFFFEVWRNIWSGVPGYPRAPASYAA